MSVQNKILNGPSKPNLISGYNDKKVLLFNFTDGIPLSGSLIGSLRLTIQLMITFTLLKLEDGSNHRWKFRGTNYRNKKFVTGSYNSYTKQGTFTVENKLEIVR
ncbi:MAG: hypothetical protein ACJAV6_000276 [Candidatus Paceibacteria bacterium]|jgi:hypothetical protein